MKKITLSVYTKALIQQLAALSPKKPTDEFGRLEVSQTASFFAILYEKIRNAVEYREAHLIRRSSIERILRRRLLLNASASGEGESIIRELMWARYFPPESLGEADIQTVEGIIQKYVRVRDHLLTARNGRARKYFSGFIYDLMTCEIEEALSPYEAKRNALQTFYIFQVLKDKVRVENITDEKKNAYFYVAIERLFAKSDRAYLRAHLFSLLYGSISSAKNPELEQITAGLPKIFQNIDGLIKNPYTDRLRRFINGQMPPFRVLFDITGKGAEAVKEIAADPVKLWVEVDRTCRAKYDQGSRRLTRLAIKAIIYIFLSKMLFALALEYPLSLHLFGEVNYTALWVNTLFPPLLMFLIVGFTRIPGAENTKRIYNRLIDVIDADRSFEASVSFVMRRARVKRPILIFTFTIFYSMTFFMTFLLLYGILQLFNFNIVSKLVFVFFVSLVSFFAHRIRQAAREYQLREKETFFRPFIDFFLMPFLSVGKILSTGISRLNFLGVVLDFLIEAPFKLIIEVIEEWVNFMRARREEIS